MAISFVPPGRFRTSAEFRERWRELDPSMDCVLEPTGAQGPLAQPIEVMGHRLENRFAIHPMEGWDGGRNGLPSEHTLRRWRRFGTSGAGLVWGGEAFAVQEDGRANPRQLFRNPAVDVLAGLVALKEQVAAGREDAGASDEPFLAGLQLTHSGRFSKPTGPGLAPRVAFRHPVLEARMDTDPHVLTDGELEAIGESYVASARLAQQAGFGFVDLKCCHGYLLHEILAGHTREGGYGGSFENRTLFLRRLIHEVRRECPGLGIGVRVSIFDVHPHVKDAATGLGTPHGWDAHVPYRYGFGVDRSDPRRPDLTEPLELLGMLQDVGVTLVNVTVGSPYYNPHLQRPAAYPPSDGYQPPEDPLLGVIAHLRAVRACRAAWPDLKLVGTGYSYLQEYLPHVAEVEVGEGHVDWIGLGRMVLSYPELPRDVLAGRELQRKKICRTFSDCTTSARHDLISGCYPLDDHYKALPEAQRLKGVKKRLRDP